MCSLTHPCMPSKPAMVSNWQHPKHTPVGWCYVESELGFPTIGPLVQSWYKEQVSCFGISKSRAIHTGITECLMPWTRSMLRGRTSSPSAGWCTSSRICEPLLTVDFPQPVCRMPCLHSHATLAGKVITGPALQVRRGGVHNCCWHPCPQW